MHCSGALVHPKLVISAAHCFSEDADDNPSWDEITVGFGVDNVALLNAPFLSKVIQKRKIKNVFIHEKYSFPEAYNDVAIVEVKKPIKLSLQVYPICIPDVEDTNVDSMRGKTAKIVGYGPDPALGKRNFCF